MGEQRQVVTFCRICEALCGLRVDVQDDVVRRIRPDSEHPLTAGFACPKGIAMAQVQNDPERIVHPLRRNAAGDLEAVSWETAVREIGDKLNAIRSRHGDEALGLYLGNPAAFSAAHLMWAKGFVDALGTKHWYTPGSQDTNSRFVASALMFGSPVAVPIPDIPRTDFLLMVGANPLISHGSLVAGGLIREDLKAVVARGGRVVVVDPRRTETAKRFEHLAVLPDSDAWLLLSLLHVIFEEGLEDRAALAAARDGDRLRALAADFAPGVTAQRTAVAPEDVRRLARDLAAAPRAAVYGRTGACLGSSSTLVNFLLDALNLATGNLDKPGGAIFPVGPVDLVGTTINQGLDTYAVKRSRVGGMPDVAGMMPAGIMADEILTPGPGQLRALVVSAGNPVLSVPDSDHLDCALRKLELLVGIDFYVNETHSRADYVLPATTFLERDDLNLFGMAYQYRPFVQWTERVVPPRGEAREEWRILRDISAAMGIVPSSVPLLRRLGRIGRAITPRMIVEGMLRTGPAGDRFGLRRGGLNGRRLRQRPHGVLLSETAATGTMSQRITHPDGKVHAAPAEIVDEVRRLADRPSADDEFPLLLFGRRELRSINTWMHNSELLNPKQIAPALLMHPHDAQRSGLEDGDTAVIASVTGHVEARVGLSEDLTPGSVSLPHAWGHDGRGRWSRANATGGANYNVLTPSGPDSLEPLAAMSHLNGVPVRVSPRGEQASDAPRHASAASIS